MNVVLMNKRIQELASLAHCSIDGMGYGEGNIEKFAKLIIQECAGIYQAIDNGNAQHGTMDYLVALRKHFGDKV